ncbi:MAG: hypothetical protein M3335_00540 [Actinomycetota bacterium]|nr:hypothetical protein [Actinomycetota bacterium]
MPRACRIALLVALCGALLAPAASGLAGAGSQDPEERWWLGPYFAGMRLTATPGETGGAFVYGDCELPEGEGGCAPPVQVQTTSSCARNPIGLDRIPREVFLLRGGGLAAVYELMADVGTGRQTVTVFSSELELMGAALREVRARSHSAPQLLAPPVYPLPVLRELKRVTAAAERLGGIEAIARATDLPADEVRLRLQVAELLGPDALAGVPVPKMSTATVERLRQLAFLAQEEPRRTARRHGISVAALRAKVRRVRGLTGSC